MTKVQLEPSTLLPCMVVLVTCQGVDGKPNVSTISEGGVLCNHPPIVGISITKSHLSNKQIKETGEFVINVASEEMMKESDICGTITGRRKDKFEMAGLTMIPSNVVKIPSIKECSVNIECKVSHILNVGVDDLFIARVVANFVDEEILMAGAIDKDHIAFGKPALDGSKWRPLLNIHGTGHYWNLGRQLEPLFYTARQRRDAKRKNRSDDT